MSFDIENIRKEFNEVIRYSQGISNPKTEELFEDFLKAKEKFIKLFGDRLIYEYPQEIKFNLSEEDRESRLKSFIEKVNYGYFSADLGDFISANKEGFYKNEVIEDYSIVGTNIVITKGMKLVKAFKYFIDNEDRLKDIQSEASRLIQEDKISGKLCFSVHPLDFLSISESTYNWRSCHSLDGEYRAGNLSYMLDKSTFICYLKSDKDVVLPRFPSTILWNNKKWRVLLYMSDNWDGIMAGRQYPFSAAGSLDFVQYLLNTTFFYDTFEIDWHDNVIDHFTDRKTNENKKLNENYIVIDRAIYPLKDIVEDDYNSLQYNDLLYSSFYLPVYILKNSYLSKPPHWTIGHEAPCLECGKNYLPLSEYMRCGYCEAEFGESEDDNYAFCNCCDRHMLVEDMVEVGDDSVLVCPDCADFNCKRCEVCGNLYFNEDIIYNEKCDMYLCPWCNRDAEENGKKYGFKDLKQYI